MCVAVSHPHNLYFTVGCIHSNCALDLYPPVVYYIFVTYISRNCEF